MKKKPARSKYHSRHAKKRPFRGGMGAGTLYAVVALLIIALGATSMIGNIVPLTSTSPTSGQPVNIYPANTEKEKSNLQLFTFPGATYTPTPAPTTPPQPQQQWKDSGGDKKKEVGNGKGPGHSAPVPGKGDGKGSPGGQNSGGIAR